MPGCSAVPLGGAVAEMDFAAKRLGTDESRLIADIAKAVPTRQVTIDCMVRLAGNRPGERPVIQDLSSSTTHTVIHAHEIQANNSAPQASQ
jgi:hypothetical protein